MKPISIVGQGFKSFAHRQKFVFPEEAGFFYLTGDNRVEPELGANGAGKTTLWDLYCWILYGRTARGLKASDISTWYGKEKCGGELVFEEDGKAYNLVRTWKPNTLKMAERGEELRTVQQEDIDKLLKLNYESFLYSVLFGQVNEMFFDLKPTPKSELFSAILNLKQWDDRSKRAKTRHTELEGFVHDYKSDISGCEGEIRGKETLNFQSLIKEFEAKRQERLAELQNEIEDHKKEIESIKVDATKLINHRKELDEEFAELQEIVTEARSIYDEITEDISSIKQEISAKEGECKNVEKDLKRFRSVEGTCPYCLQEVSDAHIEAEIDKLLAILDERDAFVGKKSKELLELEDTKMEAHQEIANISTEYSEVRDRISTNTNKQDALKREATRLSRSIRAAEQDLEKIKEEENPYTAKKQKVKEEIELLKQNIERYTKELETTEQKAESVKYWIKGFKEVRLFLISEVLTQLEVEVNNCLFQLGLKDWRIEFATDSENKSGALRKGFSVLIYSPYNTDPVSWESWSGGESQRLRLAGALGLSNLILARNGADSFVEIYDEPTQGLNDQGIQDLLETLNTRAKDLSKQIWIIDHRSLEFGGFNDSYVAVKTVEGTTIEKLEDAA